jgi:hypothetical protein
MKKFLNYLKYCIIVDLIFLFIIKKSQCLKCDGKGVNIPIKRKDKS